MRHHSIALLGIWTLESRVCSIWQCKKCACCLFCCYVYYSVPKIPWPGQKPCWVTGLHNSIFWVSCMGPQCSQIRHLHIKRPMGPGSIHFGLSLSQEHLRKPKSYNSCPSNDYHRSRPSLLITAAPAERERGAGPSHGKSNGTQSFTGGAFWLKEGLKMKLAIGTFIQVGPSTAKYSNFRTFSIK